MELSRTKNDAIERGEDYYFTGVPCANGHIAKRRVKSHGTCVLCKQRYTMKKKKADPERYLLAQAKHRAKRRGLRFSLTPDDIIIPSHCPVLGIPLKASSRSFDPNSPSLDRVNNAKGYVKGNVLVISNRANMLKKDATPAELRKLADFYDDA